MQTLRKNCVLTHTSISGPVLLLTACASNGGHKAEATARVPTPIPGNNVSMDSKVGDAIATPFSDLNLVRTEVPPILQQEERLLMCQTRDHQLRGLSQRNT